MFTDALLDIPKLNILHTEQASLFANSVARNLGLTPQEIQLINAGQFITGQPNEPQYLYGFTNPDAGSSLDADQRRAGFFKLARKPILINKLQQESQGTAIANRIGIPSIPILHPFQTTLEGFGLLHLGRLYAEDGEFLATDEIVAGAESSYGAKAARAFASISGKSIPLDIDSSFIRRNSARSESSKTFFEVWEEKYHLVFREVNSGLDSGLMDRVEEIVSQTRTEIEPVIQSAIHPDVEFFVHNDAAPHNLFFQENGDVLFLDFEHASATHNLFLAQLTDLGNYFGGMWPNPEMQQEFITAFLEEVSNQSLEYYYQLLKASIVFGSIYSASYGINVVHPEHKMAVSLLGNLENNLSVLDKKYNAMKMSTTTQ